MTFEHSIVNMFLFPAGLLLGGQFTVVDYLFWNEIPTVVGNLVGGLAFTGLTLYATHVKTAPKRVDVAVTRLPHAWRLDLARRMGLSSQVERPAIVKAGNAARAENIGRTILR